jgi:hypothetical protein
MVHGYGRGNVRLYKTELKKKKKKKGKERVDRKHGSCPRPLPAQADSIKEFDLRWLVATLSRRTVYGPRWLGPVVVEDGYGGSGWWWPRYSAERRMKELGVDTALSRIVYSY